MHRFRHEALRIGVSRDPLRGKWIQPVAALTANIAVCASTLASDLLAPVAMVGANYQAHPAGPISNRPCPAILSEHGNIAILGAILEISRFREPA